MSDVNVEDGNLREEKKMFCDMDISLEGFPCMMGMQNKWVLWLFNLKKEKQIKL